MFRGESSCGQVFEDEVNVEEVFSRTGQLSQVNVDPDGLTDMVSIMINKYSPEDVEDSDTDG